MDAVTSIFLGFVQGVTEFLPVSSTGHLVIARTLVGGDVDSSLAFDAILHLATAGAVIVYFWEELWVLIHTILRKLGRLPVHSKDWCFVQALAVGTIPAVIMGLLLESLMEGLFRHPLLVALVLVLGSLLFMYAEYVYDRNFHITEITAWTGFKVGMFQVLALIPGMSRSGATIAGAMILGISRTEATRFSFLLAVPVILGAGSKKLLELLTSDVSVAWGGILVGAATAFVVGLCAIHFMVRFVRTHTLWPFIWYRLILAGFILFMTFG